MWRAAQERLNQNRLATFSHKYNAGVGAAGLESQPPSDPVSKIAPPGLLAARQIVFEISKRNQRDKHELEKKITAITAGVVNRWQKKWLEVKDLDVGSTPCESLKMHLLLLSHLVATAPDKDSEEAVRVLSKRARGRDGNDSCKIGPSTA